MDLGFQIKISSGIIQANKCAMQTAKLYPVTDGGVLEPHVLWKHHEVWGSINLPLLSVSISLLYQGSLGGCSVRPFKAHEISSEWGCVWDANSHQLWFSSLLQVSEAPFENSCRTAIGWLQNLWLQHTASQPPKVSSFLGTTSYVLQTLEGVSQLMNISNPTCCAWR